MTQISLESVITKKTELLTSEIDGEIVMMNIETGRYISMNAVGSEIWKIIDKKSVTLGSICSELASIFNVEESVCKKETLTFCSQLLKQNLVVLS